jgi:hypothetical protein
MLTLNPQAFVADSVRISFDMTKAAMTSKRVKKRLQNFTIHELLYPLSLSLLDLH